ncbi:TetR/AcrR family transcriptional regulator [Gracilibacillus phocaeensis]|nr:TetR/AcrR family transcriptional regulator [Gracilibacillus phocaeensis]
MNGFERRKLQKKQAILETSLRLFQKKGYKKVSIAEIAKEANVSQVTIYNYLESKEKLLEEVIVYYMDQMWQRYQALMEEDMSFEQKIKQLFLDEIEIANEVSEEFLQFIMQYYTEEGNYIEKVYQEKVLPALIKLLHQGREEGYIHEQISDQTLLQYLQMFTDYLQREGVMQEMLPVSMEFSRLFFYGIAGENPGDKE